jgi:hypothetical protein
MDAVLFPVIGIVAIIGAAALSVITVRFASILAKRLEARPRADAPLDPSIGQLREELDDMHERLDFLERALLAQKDPSARALPPKGERAEPSARTPP